MFEKADHFISYNKPWYTLHIMCLLFPSTHPYANLSWRSRQLIYRLLFNIPPTKQYFTHPLHLKTKFLYRANYPRPPVNLFPLTQNGGGVHPKSAVTPDSCQWLLVVPLVMLWVDGYGYLGIYELPTPWLSVFQSNPLMSLTFP